MMIRFIFFFTLVMVILSCEQREDVITELNAAPELSFYEGNELMDGTIFNDSIKLLKGNGNEYQVRLHVKDDFNEFELGYSNTTTLNGDFQEDYINDSTLLLSYLPNGEGEHDIIITIRDNFGITKELRLILYAFTNLPPVAKLTIEKDKVGVLILNASTSFDTDERFGGGLLRYRYEIGGEVIELSEPFMRFRIDKSGLYEVKLTVIDNNGVESETVIQNITIE